MQLPPLSLYIHLPWCERKCPYCDFNSHELREIPEALYLEALLRDLQDDLELARGRRVDTLFIGGGTPSLFSPATMAALLRGIASMLELSPQLEATMEANPGSAEARKFAGFREAGINRLSLGVQSLDDRCLRALGRVHDSRQAHAAIEYALAADFDSINIDLMHGLPGQAPASASADLEMALAYRPPHLSWYQLTIEPNTVFHKRPPLLPEEESLADIQREGEQLLAAAGYSQYEVSAYSLPGLECRHNLNYWRFGDYLGVGAGAHGKVTLADGTIARYAKRRQPAQYMGAGPGGFRAGLHIVEPGDVPGEFMMNALRLNAGFTLEQFEARTAMDGAVLESRLQSLVGRGLLQREGSRVRASALGRRYLDSVIAEFFPD